MLGFGGLRLLCPEVSRWLVLAPLSLSTIMSSILSFFSSCCYCYFYCWWTSCCGSWFSRYACFHSYGVFATDIFLLFLSCIDDFDPCFRRWIVLPLCTIESEYANNYLHDLNGIAISFYCHSSLTSITSGALPNSSAAFRYSFACLISDAVYSGMSVFMMFQK